jgi:2-methylisocitrate lyase-like PEP mutase family enzyme
MGKQKQGRRGFIKAAGIATGALGAAMVSSTPSSGQAGQASSSGQRARTQAGRLRDLLAKAETIVAPIVPDIMTARMCELEGFPAVQIGDSQPTAWHGFPSLGLVSYTEVLNFSLHIAANTGIAVMVGMADGGGSPLTIYRATRELERGGVAAVAYEDSTPQIHFAKTGGVVSSEEFVDRIKAAVDARQDPDFLVIARTNAAGQGLGTDEALRRGVACAAAGADVIYLSGVRLEDCLKAQQTIKKPLFYLGNSRTTPNQARLAGISMIAYHTDFVAHGALYQALKELKATGTFEKSAALALPSDIQAKLARTDDYMSRARKYHVIE